MKNSELGQYDNSSNYQEQQTQAELWVNNIANNLAKLITLLVMSHAREPLSRTQLYSEIKERCGGSMPYSVNAFTAYCKTLEKTGAVVKSETQAVVSQQLQTVQGYEITTLGEQDGVAFAGLLLDWQLRNPELPLQKLLGTSSSSVEGKYAPVLRLLMLADLVEQHDNQRGPAVGALATEAPHKASTKHATVESLAADGFVNFKSQNVENERSFYIIDEKYHKSPRGIGFENLRPETKLIYQALVIAKKIRDQWKVDEFLRLCAAVSDSDDPTLMRKVRSRLQNGLAPSTASFRQNISAIPGRHYEGMSIVKLKPEHLEPVRELVQIVDGFVGGNPQVIAHGYHLADGIYKRKEILGALLNFAHDISSHTAADPKMKRRLLGIIEANPGIDKKQATVIYREMRGKQINLETVNKLISVMSKHPESRIVLSEVRTSSVKDKTHRVYSITGLDEVDSID